MHLVFFLALLGYFEQCRLLCYHRFWTMYQSNLQEACVQEDGTDTQSLNIGNKATYGGNNPEQRRSQCNNCLPQSPHCISISDLCPKHTECPGGNVSDFGRMFLTLKYTDITQNTYIRS